MAFALDFCDRESSGFVATTEGIKGEDVQDLILLAVEARFGRVNCLPQTIEWLTDNGSGTIAGETRRLARDIGLEPRTTPVQSLQSNGMIEMGLSGSSEGSVSLDYAQDGLKCRILAPFTELQADDPA